jgi:hypothetical protein
MFTEGTDLFKWTARIMFNSFVSQYRRKTKFETQYDPSAYIDSLSVSPNQEEAMETTMGAGPFHVRGAGAFCRAVRTLPRLGRLRRAGVTGGSPHAPASMRPRSCSPPSWWGGGRPPKSR